MTRKNWLNLERIYTMQAAILLLRECPKLSHLKRDQPSIHVILSKIRKTIPKYAAYTEVRSCSLSGAHSTVVQVGIMKNGIVNTVVPYIDMSTIPIGILFQALGSGDEMDMVRYIASDITDTRLLSLLIPSFEQSKICDSQTSALYYIGPARKKVYE